MRSRFPTYTPMSTIALSFLTLPLLSDTFSFLPSCFVTSSEKLKATLPCCSVFLRQSCAEGVGEGLDAATLAVLDALLDVLRGVRLRPHWPLLIPQVFASPACCALAYEPLHVLGPHHPYAATVLA